MATKKPAPRKKAAAKRPAARSSVARRPARHRDPLHRLAAWLGRVVAHHAARHTAAVRSRKDAAILRATHAGCATCQGTGTIFTKDKNGTFSGSKPCPAKPTTIKVSRVKIHAAARVGVDKHSGLIGWRCPCGKHERPRHRDAKAATAALRVHEKAKHGGTTVGGAWYAQLPEGTAPAKPVTAATPVSKTATTSTMTDAEWEKQNSRMAAGTATRKGLCWSCGGKGALYTALGGVRKTVVCALCNGTGKPAAARATAGGG